MAEVDVIGEWSTTAESVFRGDQTAQEAAWEGSAEETEPSGTYSDYVPACLRQTTKVDVWGDEATEQEDTEADEARQSLRLRFQKLSTKVQGSLRRRVFHLRSRSAPEGYDDFGYEERAWDNWGDSSEPLTSSRFEKLASSLKGFIRKYSPRRQRTNSYQESTLAGDSWQTPEDKWGLEGIDVEVNREETEQAIPQLAKQLGNFTEPLAESSDVEAEDFLSRFLSTRRQVDIHGDRKHKLAMFLARVCEEASFAFVSRHDPGMLPLLQISTPDQVEFEVWITLVGHVRRRNRALDDGCRWPDPDSWSAFPNPRESDNVTRLRHVAVHRWDYNSKLIEDVVWYLEKLSDQTRLRQVGKALRELYYDECAASLERTIRGASVEDEDSSNPPSLTSTLLGFQDEVGCTPGIEMPIGATTYQQLLRSCQHILERSLFNFARQKFPSELLSCGHTCASQIELNQYSNVFHNEMRKALPDIPQAQVSDLLYAARMFRNASAHHHEFDLDIPITRTVAARSDAGWLGAPEHNATPPEPPVDVNKDRFSEAEAVALMVGDEEAAAKIRLLVHVADVNIRTAVQKAKMEEAQRSVVDWEGLKIASAGQKSAWKLEGREGWVLLRLGGSQWYFSSKAWEARERLGEVGEILRRWEERLSLRLKDPARRELF
ncbi:MAG: hypothetical protein Q9172_005400 [Xanthocarpia lactea]